MRYPRILTCSSARPRYRNCPSAPQDITSPVRYIRSPDAPNGHATNRDALNPDRPTYPYANPAPATYNSPTTPGGTGRNHPSSTKKPRCANGTPIGLTALSTSTAQISLTEACTGVSVIPYILISRGEAGCAANHEARRCGSRASPPNTTASSLSCPPNSGASASAACNA